MELIGLTRTLKLVALPRTQEYVDCYWLVYHGTVELFEPPRTLEFIDLLQDHGFGWTVSRPVSELGYWSAAGLWTVTLPASRF